jgi:hypothetical protein
MIKSIEKSNDIGNRTCDLPACSIVQQPTMLRVTLLRIALFLSLTYLLLTFMHVWLALLFCLSVLRIQVCGGAYYPGGGAWWCLNNARRMMAVCGFPRIQSEGAKPQGEVTTKVNSVVSMMLQSGRGTGAGQ